MGATVYLHVGMPKTGSTSIQHTFFNNRTALLARGINYLSMGRNHAGILLPLLSDNPHEHRRNVRRGIDTPDKAQAHNKAVEDRLHRELASNRSPKIVISGEAFSVAPASLVRRLKDKFAPFADDWCVIMYVRDPYQYINSASLQRVKGGALLETSGDNLPLPAYRGIQNYIDIFGRQRVDIRVFDAAHFKGGDLINDFFDAIDEPPESAKDLDVVRINSSLSHEAALILSAINAAVPVAINGRSNPSRAKDIHFLLEGVKGVKYVCDPECYRKYEKRILADVEWLNAQLEREIFRKPQPGPASTPQWSAGTMHSIVLLVRNIVSRLDGKNKAATESALTPYLTDELSWLKPALDPGTPLPAMDRHLPFDAKAVARLGSLLHELAYRAGKENENKRPQGAAAARSQSSSGFSRILRTIFRPV